MLEVSASAQEMVLGIDFAETYKNSDLYRLVIYNHQIFIRDSSFI